MGGAPRSASTELRKLFPKSFLLRCQRFGNRDFHHGVEVTTGAVFSRKPTSWDAELAPVPGAGRDLELGATIGCRNGEFPSEDGLPWRDIRLVVDVSAFKTIVGMLLKLHPQVEITGLTPGSTRTSLTGQPDALSLADTLWDLDCVGLDIG